MTGERGVALIVVMLVLALLALVVTEFAYSALLEASMVRAYRDGVLARHLAEATYWMLTKREVYREPGSSMGAQARDSV